MFVCYNFPSYPIFSCLIKKYNKRNKARDKERQRLEVYLFIVFYCYLLNEEKKRKDPCITCILIYENGNSWKKIYN